MKKEVLVICLAVLVVGLGAIGAFVYINQSNLNYQRELQAEKAKEEQAKKQEAADADARSRAQYYICTSQAATEKNNQLKANSDYETKDESGGTIYHGNRAVFDQIDESYQSELNRCAS